MIWVSLHSPAQVHGQMSKHFRHQTNPHLLVDTAFVGFVVTAEAYSQELRLAGTSNAIDWVIGGFYTDSEENQAAKFRSLS